MFISPRNMAHTHTHTFAGEHLDFSGTLMIWVSMTHIFKGGFASSQEYNGIHIGMISRQDKDETTTQMCLNLSTTQSTNERYECISFLRIFPKVLGYAEKSIFETTENSRVCGSNQQPMQFVHESLSKRSSLARHA